MDSAIQYGCTKLMIEKLKPEQDRAVRSFVEENDVFICLPTGYGKSLCFAVLPHLFDYLRSHGSSNGTSILICVVPLQSLMSDQYQRFKKCLSVAVISTDIEHVTLERVLNGEIALIYISPESLLANVKYREMLRSPVYQSNLVGFVVDEAHTVKRW